jgi:hypothetical protein
MLFCKQLNRLAYNIGWVYFSGYGKGIGSDEKDIGLVFRLSYWIYRHIYC